MRSVTLYLMMTMIYLLMLDIYTIRIVEEKLILMMNMFQDPLLKWMNKNTSMKITIRKKMIPTNPNQKSTSVFTLRAKNVGKGKRKIRFSSRNLILISKSRGRKRSRNSLSSHHHPSQNCQKTNMNHHHIIKRGSMERVR